MTTLHTVSISGICAFPSLQTRGYVWSPLLTPSNRATFSGGSRALTAVSLEGGEARIRKRSSDVDAKPIPALDRRL